MRNKKMKTVKITKYICSDGKEFIGGINKNMAKAHERMVQNSKLKFDFEHTIAKIVNARTFLSGVEDFDNEKKSGDHNHETIWEAFNAGYYDYDVGSSIDELFENYTCPDDLAYFTDMAEMVVMIIDNFGGIDAITELYRFMKENG
jgi:hypothetical protein